MKDWNIIYKIVFPLAYIKWLGEILAKETELEGG